MFRSLKFLGSKFFSDLEIAITWKSEAGLELETSQEEKNLSG